MAQVEVQRQLHERLLSSKKTSKFSAGTRYDEDFLSRPRTQVGRREGKRSSDRPTSDHESEAIEDRAVVGRESRAEGAKKEKRVRGSSKKRVAASQPPVEGEANGTGVSGPQESSDSDDSPSFTIIEDPQLPADDPATVAMEVSAGMLGRGQAEYSEELRRRLGVIDTQLSRLREARKQIDSAIATLEGMRERCSAPGS